MSRFMNSHMAWGQEVGRGLRTVVYGLDSHRVIKVPMAGTPDHWLQVECSNLLAAKAAGAPCPGSAAVIEANGRSGLASERINGAKFSTLVLDDPLQAGRLAAQLVELQVALFRCSVSMTVPRQQDRLAAKVMEASSLHSLDVGPMLAFLDAAVGANDAPLGLCHGDMHPDNVLVDQDGLVLVDWFDASRGLLVA